MTPPIVRNNVAAPLLSKANRGISLTPHAHRFSPKRQLFHYHHNHTSSSWFQKTRIWIRFHALKLRRKYSTQHTTTTKHKPILTQIYENFRKDPLSQMMHVILAGGATLYFNADKLARQKKSRFEKSKGGQIEMILDNMEHGVSFTHDQLGSEEEIARMYTIHDPEMMEYLLSEAPHDESSTQHRQRKIAGFLVLVEKGSPALLNSIRHRKHTIYFGSSTGKLKNDLINALGLNRNSLDFETSDIFDVLEDALTESKQQGHVPLIVLDSLARYLDKSDFRHLATKMSQYAQAKRANIIFVNTRPTCLQSIDEMDKLKLVQVAQINKSYMREKLLHVVQEAHAHLTESDVDLLVRMTGGETKDIDEILQRMQINGSSVEEALSVFCRQDSESLIDLLMEMPDKKFVIAIHILDSLLGAGANISQFPTTDDNSILDEVTKHTEKTKGIDIHQLSQHLTDESNASVQDIFSVSRKMIEEGYLDEDGVFLKEHRPIQRVTVRCAITSPWVVHRMRKLNELREVCKRHKFLQECSWECSQECSWESLQECSQESLQESSHKSSQESSQQSSHKSSQESSHEPSHKSLHEPSQQCMRSEKSQHAQRPVNGTEVLSVSPLGSTQGEGKSLVQKEKDNYKSEDASV